MRRRRGGLGRGSGCRVSLAFSWTASSNSSAQRQIASIANPMGERPSNSLTANEPSTNRSPIWPCSRERGGVNRKRTWKAGRGGYREGSGRCPGKFPSGGCCVSRRRLGECEGAVRHLGNRFPHSDELQKRKERMRRRAGRGEVEKKGKVSTYEFVAVCLQVFVFPRQFLSQFVKGFRKKPVHSFLQNLRRKGRRRKERVFGFFSRDGLLSFGDCPKTAARKRREKARRSQQKLSKVMKVDISNNRDLEISTFPFLKKSFLNSKSAFS